MNFKEVQTRQRPRVAIVGINASIFKDDMFKIFPHPIIASSFNEIESKFSSHEIDLLILMGSFNEEKVPRWIENMHIISFADSIDYLPGPLGSTLSIFEASKSEECKFQNIDSSLDILLTRSVPKIRGCKNFTFINAKIGNEEARRAVLNNALILDHHLNRAYIGVYTTNSGKQIAILQRTFSNKLEWIRLLISKWSIIDDVFSQYSEENDIKWKTKEETDIATKIKELGQAKEEYIKNVDDRIAVLEANLREQGFKDNQGLRRLIKGQGDELVDEVKKCFERFGFRVCNMDKERPEGKIKIEDLRISDPNDSEWVAIAEVKGYEKSTGKTADLQQIQRFVEFFMKETGKFPNRRFYIVNGAFELAYSQRRPPFESNPEDVEMFGESGGLIISTLDLFQIIKNITPETDLKKIRDVMKSKTGRLDLSDFGLNLTLPQNNPSQYV